MCNHLNLEALHRSATLLMLQICLGIMVSCPIMLAENGLTGFWQTRILAVPPHLFSDRMEDIIFLEEDLVIVLSLPGHGLLNICLTCRCACSCVTSFCLCLQCKWPQTNNIYTLKYSGCSFVFTSPLAFVTGGKDDHFPAMKFTSPAPPWSCRCALEVLYKVTSP